MSDGVRRPGGWIVCPECGLKHSVREDGYCPRCRSITDPSAVDPASSSAGLAPPMTSDDRSPPRASDPVQALARAASASPSGFSFAHDRSGDIRLRDPTPTEPTATQIALGLIAGLVAALLWAVVYVQLTTLTGYILVPMVLVLGPAIAVVMRLVGARGPIPVLVGAILLVGSFASASLIGLDRTVTSGSRARLMTTQDESMLFPIVWDLSAYGEVPSSVAEELVRLRPTHDDYDHEKRLMKLILPYAETARIRIRSLPDAQLEAIAQSFVEASYAETTLADRLDSTRTPIAIVCGVLSLLMLIRILWD